MSGRRAGPARLPIYFSGFAVAKDSEGKAPFVSLVEALTSRQRPRLFGERRGAGAQLV